MLGTWAVTMMWDDENYTTEYDVQVVGVECMSLVGYFRLVGTAKFTKMTGHFPIRMIEKMEKIA